MRYTLAVGTSRGEVLEFRIFGAAEYLTAVAVAREQSRNAAWTEVRDSDSKGKVCCRYRDGWPEWGQEARVWREDHLSYQRRVFSRPAPRHPPGSGDHWP